MKLGSGAGRAPGRGAGREAALAAVRATTGAELEPLALATAVDAAAGTAGTEAATTGTDAACTGGATATAEATGGGGAAAIDGAGAGVGTTTAEAAGRGTVAVGAVPGAAAVDVAGCDAAPCIFFRSLTFLFSSATRAAEACRSRSVERRSSALPAAAGGVTPPLLSFSVSALGLADCFLSSIAAWTLPPPWRRLASALGVVDKVDEARRCR